MNNNKPLVTVNILSYNRKDELKNTLSKVYEQDYNNIEVIVVDNASCDESPEMVKNDFPEVKLIQLNKNIGIGGWNEGFKAAKGEYILVLDDDSYPNITTISKGIEFFDTHKDYSILTFNVFNLGLRESETSQYKLINPHLFHGCGTLINKNVLDKISGYDSSYFLYYNEIDFAIRSYNLNFKIRYSPELFVFHRVPHDKNNKEIQSYHTHKIKYEQYFSGHIRFLIKHFDIKYVIVYGLKWILNRFIVSIFYGYYFSFLKSFLKIPYIFLKSLKSRHPVKNTVQEYYNFGNSPIIDRDFFPDFVKPRLFRKRNNL